MICNLFEFIRYGITGILSLVTYLLFSNLLHYFGCSIWFSTGVAWVLSVIVSYFGHIHFSYRVTAAHKRMLSRYVLMLAFHLLQTAGITYVLADVIGLSYPTTTVLTVLITPLTTYPLGKYYVFRES